MFFIMILVSRGKNLADALLEFKVVDDLQA
jgi:hypothetical protein